MARPDMSSLAPSADAIGSVLGSALSSVLGSRCSVPSSVGLEWVRGYHCHLPCHCQRSWMLFFPLGLDLAFARLRLLWLFTQKLIFYFKISTDIGEHNGNSGSNISSRWIVGSISPWKGNVPLPLQFFHFPPTVYPAVCVFFFRRKESYLCNVQDIQTFISLLIDF